MAELGILQSRIHSVEHDKASLGICSSYKLAQEQEQDLVQLLRAGNRL